MKTGLKKQSLSLITDDELNELKSKYKKNLSPKYIDHAGKLFEMAFKNDPQMIKLFHTEKYKESFGKPIKRFFGLTKADPKNPLEKTRKILTGEKTISTQAFAIDLGAAVIIPPYDISTFKTTLCILPDDFTEEGESGAFKKLLTVLLDGAEKVLTTSKNKGVKEEKEETEKERELSEALKVVFKTEDRREGVDSPTLFNALVNYISSNQREMAQPDPVGCCCFR